mmetsp:Transcript_2347/g.3493  ORF Transcript_2347/g.3493 Transcript_2347/m.3493 type:complete len:462 (-) Transcript_2347:230-1615(-)|eukprot:CAMPEP_0194094062 /NCGR_PEP_ID=MMETSP0149-20130528/52557_1 /TAXON_ID=122233 /ORGANISM="Chaetoceros debilis, Strain MM31A-1" /LENGTH=461 /DNA_ID=CAMNT_0038779579 /DNA_START=173 /DNA_END=1558 /DNA_ORIENTATION=+
MLDNCSDTCGWISGLIAALSFGSFGVPIKFISNVKVDPLVMQSYKSMICFLTCWLVIPLGEPFKFTPWGIVSGAFWVPGATAGIYGIRNAGLAISVGTWSSLMVISSFCWGIFVFGERVKSVEGACGAACVLVVGLVGMSIYSSPVKTTNNYDHSGDGKKGKFEDDDSSTGATTATASEWVQSNADVSKKEMTPLLRDDSINEETNSSDEEAGVELQEIIDISIEGSGHTAPTSVPTDTNLPSKRSSSRKVVRRKAKNDNSEGNESIELLKKRDKTEEKEEKLSFFNGKVRLTRRQLGIVGAIVNGTWGSNSMIPMHYARKQGFYGAGYLISYSCGSMLITILLWIIRYLHNVYLLDGNYKDAYYALPSFHVREMWVVGLLSGSLYSLGNFCSIITVTALGQGVGYSFTQTSMLISGIWGIFFFQEVQGTGRILKWIMSSIITIAGILWLSYEHVGSTEAH